MYICSPCGGMQSTKHPVNWDAVLLSPGCWGLGATMYVVSPASEVQAGPPGILVLVVFPSFSGLLVALFFTSYNESTAAHVTPT